MTSPSPLARFDEVERVRRMPPTDGAAHPVRAFGQSVLRVAALFDDAAQEALLHAFQAFSGQVGLPIECRLIPAALARGGTVGRIGVPREATAVMQAQQVVIGATVGGDPLAPVTRLWRGLQRRAEVTVDLRQCTTLPGSAADRSGNQRDILLFSQRVLDATPRRRRGGAGGDMAHEWARARDAAEMAYRVAAAEQRRLLLVLPVGRSTDAQQLFSDALERQARLHRMQPPRTVKAGLLSALLSGDAGRERWLVASVIPIDDLSAMACEAVGDAGPWPVIGVGRHATFCDMPASHGGAPDPLPLMLVISTLLHRNGRAEMARTLLQAALVTSSAERRMREELGSEMPVPVEAYLSGLLANWGRVPVTVAPRDRRSVARDDAPMVAGLRLRIETSLSAVALRDAVSAALAATGLEVASVRSADGLSGRDVALYDVRVRSRLGEPPLGDGAAFAIASVLDRSLRCLSVEPWSPSAAAERGRATAAG
ncbi:MAG: hypothetical protein V4813_18835 [Gemmatimonadota bacterium]